MRLTSPKAPRDLRASLAKFRRADEGKEAPTAKPLTAPPQDTGTRLRELKAKLLCRLIADFKLMAPGHAVHAYRAYIESEDFEQRLLQELTAQKADLQDFPNEDDSIPWLVLLVNRKEVDLAGMVSNARVP